MRTTIIAEAGVNHNGDLVLAKKLIDVAVEAGADYVKFQTFKAEKLVSKDAKKAEYQQRNMESTNDSQLQMLKALELSIDHHHILMQYARAQGIKFLSTGFDLESLEFLNNLGIDFFKVPSGELTNYTYLKKIAEFGKPVVVSTGMAYQQEVEDALTVLGNNGVSKQNITVLHCNTEYPTPMSDVNLRAMVTMGNSFGVSYGYSDHTLGIEIPIAAVALGATIIEKHFTLDQNLPGPDHKASLEPQDFIKMVTAIRQIETALGDGVKRPSASEFKNRSVARKSIYTFSPIKKGELITEDKLIALRPGEGISPMHIPQIVNKKAKLDISAGVMLTLEDFE